ncbi:MAG: 50S ribosomal protein L6, partial [Candidatus Pacearchaeota archaeon]
MNKEGNTREIILEEGYEFSIDRNIVKMKYGGKELTKIFPLKRKVKISCDGKKIKIYSEGKTTRRELAQIGTIYAHITNMIRGLKEPFVYKMELCNAHFPATLKVEGDYLIIKNFLGEKVDRKAKILKGVEVKIKGNILELISSDIDAVGQTMANIERATKIVDRDRRVFQDGIFLIEKKGERI